MEGDERRPAPSRAPLMTVPLPDVQPGTLAGG